MPLPRMTDPDTKRLYEQAKASGKTEAEAMQIAKDFAAANRRDPLQGLVSSVPLAGNTVENLVWPGQDEQQAASRIQMQAMLDADKNQAAIPGAPSFSRPGIIQPGTPATTPFADDAYLGQGYTGPDFGAQSLADDRVLDVADVGGQQPLHGQEARDLMGQRAALAERTRDIVRPGTPGQITALEDAFADPDAIAAQKRALQGLTEIVDQGGLTAIDRARMDDTRRANDQWLRGQRQATLANMEARGMRGSGAELMAQLQSQQSAADRASMENLQTEAMAQQRAMDALSQLGTGGGQVRSQSYGEALNKAQAIDSNRRWEQKMLQDWEARKRRDEWDRYYAQQEAEASRYNRQMGHADRTAQRGREQQARSDAIVGAGISYALGGPAGAAASQAVSGGRPQQQPSGYGYGQPSRSSRYGQQQPSGYDPQPFAGYDPVDTSGVKWG